MSIDVQAIEFKPQKDDQKELTLILESFTPKDSTHEKEKEVELNHSQWFNFTLDFEKEDEPHIFIDIPAAFFENCQNLVLENLEAQCCVDLFFPERGVLSKFVQSYESQIILEMTAGESQIVLSDFKIESSQIFV